MGALESCGGGDWSVTYPGMDNPTTPYTRKRTRRELRTADQTRVLNYSITDHLIATGFLERYYPADAVLVEVVDTYEVCASDRVLIDSGIDEAHWPLIRADARRFLNSSPDAGRPSDAMRSAVRAFRGGYLS